MRREFVYAPWRRARSYRPPSIQPRRQKRHRRLHAQDAFANRDRRESDALQRRDLSVDEASLGADDERYRFANSSRTLLGRMRMRDEGARAAGERRQFILDEWAEETAGLDRREDGVARLFESEDRLCAEVFGSDAR